MTRRLLISPLLAGVVACAIWTGADVRLRGNAQTAETIRVDFQALGVDGQPVPDLKVDEVSVRVAGRARVLKALQFVRLAGTAAAGPAVPAPFGSNTGGADGRRIAIIVEDETLRPGADRLLREALGKVLDGLGRADRVSVATAPRDSIRLGFTGDLAAAREAVATRIQGRASPGAADALDTCRTRDTLAQLRSQMASMAGGDAPTAVLFFSSKLAIPSTAQQRSATAGECEINAQAFQDVSTAAAIGQAQFYVIQQDETLVARDEGLDNLAGATGAGQVVRLADPGSLGRVLAETSGDYLATVAAESSDRSGQAQRLEVRVTRSGVAARARPEWASSAKAGKSAVITPQQMLRETRAYRDLPVRAVAFASRGASGRMSVIALAEPADPSTSITAAAVGLIDPAGRLVAQATAGEKELAASPITIATAVAPGAYRLRFAVVDGTGRSGAADYELFADLTPAGPLKLGSLMIGSLRDNAMRMGVQFHDEEKLVGYLEMYGPISGQVAARMEVAESVDGPAIATIQPGGNATTEPDRFILTGEIPIAALAPGDYVVRAFVGIVGQPEGKVIKSFRKAAR